MNKNVEKYLKELYKLSQDFDIPYPVVATIALNESGCDPNVKPYFEKTWKYFTDRQGKPLDIHGSAVIVQRRALEVLGQQEFDFQVRAWGAFQCTGSVLRELGFTADEFTKDFYSQGFFAMKHLSKMRDRFVAKYKKQPTDEQLFASYNGGMGSVEENGIKEWVEGYVYKSMKNIKDVA